MRTLSLASLLICSLIGCKKEDDPLPETFEVTYYVLCEDCSISHGEPDGTIVSVSSHKGEVSYSGIFNAGSTYRVYTRNNLGKGSVTVRVYIDGVLVDEKTMFGGRVVVNISGNYRLTGKAIRIKAGLTTVAILGRLADFIMGKRCILGLEADVTI